MSAPVFQNVFEKLFFQALRIRLIEQKIADLYPSDKIQSPVHLSIGQEHLAVALCEPMRETDLVFGTYRSHALYLAKGGCLKAMMSELYGKVSGCGKGKAGSMHLSYKDKGVMGSSAVVGATISHAVGAALAARVRKSGQVVASFFGEGATGQGVYHESLNVASLKNLPVLFVCENNGLAIYTRAQQIQSYSLMKHAESFGIKAIKVENSYDLDEMLEVSKEAIAYARENSRPVFLEVVTHRDLQHVGPKADYDLNYRPNEDRAIWAAKDPLIQRLDLVEKYTPAILKEIEEAVIFAESDRFPTEAELFMDLV